MRPIELTRIRDSGKTESLYVNPAHIVSFIPGWSDVGAVVDLTTTTYRVKETPEQIIVRLADHRSSVHAEERDGIQVYR